MRYRALEVRDERRDSPSSPAYAEGVVLCLDDSEAPPRPVALYRGPVVAHGESWSPLGARGDHPDRWADLTPDAVRVRLRALIDASGRTQADVAHAAGMSQQQLSQLLTGYRADPAASTVGRILAALGCSWRDLD